MQRRWALRRAAERIKEESGQTATIMWQTPTRKVLVGDIEYYSKFGFDKGPTRGISLGDGLDDGRLLGLNLKKNFLNEVIGSLIKSS